MHNLQTKLLKLLGKIDFSKESLRSIAKLVGEKYPQKIKHHITQLEKNGLISVDWVNKRVQVVSRNKLLVHGSKPSPLLLVPVVGTANCGPATIFADQNVEGFVKVSKVILGIKTIGDFFAIRASGDSMNRAKIAGKSIEDGDLVIVDPKQKDPRSGDYVLSIVDNMANIKRFFRDSKNMLIRLMSESTQEYAPIYISPTEDYLIAGKVIYVIKRS